MKCLAKNKGRANKWERVDSEKCTKYIGYLHKVLPIVSEWQGKALRNLFPAALFRH